MIAPLLTGQCTLRQCLDTACMMMRMRHAFGLVRNMDAAVKHVMDSTMWYNEVAPSGEILM